MVIGLDVGGTNIDTVLIGKKGIMHIVKKPADYDCFLQCVISSIEEVSRDINPRQIKKIVLSTTVSTNTIVENRNSQVGLMIEHGPGLKLELPDPKMLAFFVPGYIDHRGREAHPLNLKEVEKGKTLFLKENIKYVGIVGKFSVRNPQHEMAMSKALADSFEYISLGHTLSGELNFPRRINTAFLNSSIYREYRKFAEGVAKALQHLDFKCPVFVLKADGGSINLNRSIDMPVETILSGPAASIMGGTAFMDTQEDIVVLDIGGTTTDISFFADGTPLYEPRGVEINGFKTLVKGLYTRSIGIGGDSQIKLEGNSLKIGPVRRKPAAFGGQHPTPTDAMKILGLIEEGSHQKAVKALKPLAQSMNTGVKDMAELVIRQMCKKISEKVISYLDQVNSRPVYTIHELLHGKKLRPQKAVLMGGPAGALKDVLSRELGMECILPGVYRVANSLGAALSRTTAELTMVVDTAQGYMLIGEEGHRERIPSNFTLEDARKLILHKLLHKAKKYGFKGGLEDLHIVEQEIFNMVRGFYTTGTLIKLKARIKPGLEEEYIND